MEAYMFLCNILSFVVSVSEGSTFFDIPWTLYHIVSPYVAFCWVGCWQIISFWLQKLMI